MSERIIPPHIHEPITELDRITQHRIASDEMRLWMDRVHDNLYTPDNTIVINKLDDFAVQDDTTITLEDNYLYMFGNREDLLSAKRFIVGENVTMTKGSLTAPGRLVYTGAGSMFTGVDCKSFHVYNHSFACPNAEMFTFTDNTVDTTFFIQNLRSTSGSNSELVAQKYGTFTNVFAIVIRIGTVAASIEGGSSLGVNDGITVTGDTSFISIIEQVLLSTSASFVGLDFEGVTNLDTAFEIANFVNIGTAPGSVGFKGAVNSQNLSAGILGTFRDCEFIGAITPLEGITSKDIRFNFQNCAPVSDSTVAARLKIEANTSITTMSADPTPINALWTDGEVEERMCFGDKLTFDNTTNTCTTEDGAIDVNGGTAFNHGLSNGDTLQLLEGGTLPTGLAEGTIYYVGNVTATTFQLYPDDTLTTPVNFTDNGTAINYYCHEQGNSQSGWVIYLGESTTDIRTEGWVSIQKTGGGTVGVRAVLMQTDTSYNVTRRQNGAEVDSSNNILSSSQVTDIKRTAPGEGFIVYVENISGTTNNEITNALVGFSKA